MPLVSKHLPGLYNGVSQQADVMRLETQCEIQENAVSHLVDGLTKRPPTEFIRTLETSEEVVENALVHIIDRDINERYVAIFNGDGVEVYTLDGEQCQVDYETPEDKLYVTSGNSPEADIRAVTVADHTIVVNKRIAPEAIEEYFPQQMPNESLVWIKRGVASTDYIIEVEKPGPDAVSVKVTYTTGAPSAASDAFNTTEIAEELYDLLKDQLEPLFDVELLGSVIRVSLNDSLGDYTIKASDGYGNQASVAIKNSVQKVQDLPLEAPEGFVLKIEGEAGSEYDDFYVKYILNETGSGIWQETVEPGKDVSLDPSTMPRGLVRIGHNHFEVRELEWEPRLIGGDLSAPLPTFVGEPIQDVFFANDRLGFLAGEAVVLSRAGDYFNFFPGTAMDVLDDDPIDVRVSTNQVARLRHAVPYAGSILLFSDKQQFILSSGGGPLTPSTVAIDPSTSFEACGLCKPVNAGPNVYFVVPKGEFSSVREYYVQPGVASNDAADVTAHVPRYLKRIGTLNVSPSRDLLIATSRTERNTVYVYKYYWDGDDKVQSSWSRWTFSHDVIGLGILDSYVFLVMRTSSGKTLLERINLEDLPTGDLDFRIHLDSLWSVEVPQGEGYYSVELPYDELPLDDVALVYGETGSQILDFIIDDDKLKVAMDPEESFQLYLGIPYVMHYRFSKFYLRDDRGVAQLQGRLQLRSLALSFTDTGYYRVQVTPKGREPLNQEYTAVILGSAQLGSPGIESGEKRFLILGNSHDTSIDVYNDSYLPSQLQSAGFEGFWTTRSRPI